MSQREFYLLNLIKIFRFVSSGHVEGDLYSTTVHCSNTNFPLRAFQRGLGSAVKGAISESF